MNVMTLWPLPWFHLKSRHSITNKDAKTKVVQILHISDIHRAPNSPVQNTSLLGELRLDINNYANYNDKILLHHARALSPVIVPGINRPDLIVLSGDLTQTATEEEFDVAFRFLEGLLELVDGERDRIILVPGNHDLSWEISADSFEPATEAEFSAQPKAIEPYPALVKASTRDGSFWRKNERNYPQRFEPFARFFERFYGGRYAYPLDRSRMYTIYDHSARYGVVLTGFNSCDEVDGYRDSAGGLHSLDVRGFINSDAIHNAGREIARYGNDILRVAVFHHNIRSVNWKPDFLNPALLHTLRDYGFNLCLHGHVHTPSQDNFFDTITTHNLPVVGAGSLAAPYIDRPPAAPKGYNIVVFEPTDGSIWVHTRQNDENRPGWRPHYNWEMGRPFYPVRMPPTPPST